MPAPQPDVLVYTCQEYMDWVDAQNKAQLEAEYEITHPEQDAHIHLSNKVCILKFFEEKIKAVASTHIVEVSDPDHRFLVLRKKSM